MDRFTASLSTYMDSFTKYLDSSEFGDVDRMDTLATFLAEFNVRLQDRRYCRYVGKRSSLARLQSFKYVFE